MNSIFLQPRHSYAPDEGNGHVHLSAPLITAAARIKATPHQGAIDIRDENFEKDHHRPLDADIIGINLIGAPYIPVVREIIRTRVRAGSTVLLGGQIIGSLSNDEFNALFQLREDIQVRSGDDKNTCEIFKIDSLPPQEEVSSIDVWSNLDESLLKQYLNDEFSFYLSQGCHFNCDFCQAAKAQKERYRNLNIAEKDLRWLSERANDFGIHRLRFYLSNLDIFQTPEQFNDFCGRLALIQASTKIELDFRGLSTVTSLLRKVDLGTLIAARRAGLSTVGLGVDGASEAIWRSVNKKHNGSVEDCEDAIRIIRRLGFQPEVLMVCGFPGDTEETLQIALNFSEKMKREVGAIIRPHAEKNIIPGARAWKLAKNRGMVDFLMTNPNAFQALDYLALPSELTHPQREHQDLVTRFFRALCELDDGSSVFVYPNVPEYQRIAASMGTTISALNHGKYDR